MVLGVATCGPHKYACVAVLVLVDAHPGILQHLIAYRTFKFLLFLLTYFHEDVRWVTPGLYRRFPWGGEVEHDLQKRNEGLYVRHVGGIYLCIPSKS